jgi:hypothetical protein
MAAGHVIVVLLVAAIVGSFLNAAGIRKTANGQRVGIRRDVARAFAEPLYDVSHAFRIDQVRRGVQAVVGRSGDDDIDATIPDPVTPPNVDPAAATPIEPRKKEFSPTFPLKVWVGGDSLSITPGESFVNIAPGTEVISVAGNGVDGHVATGLARPEVFNWPAHMADVIAREQPNAVMLTLGSNDDQSLTGESGVGPYASPEWIAEYRRRVGGTMDAITGNRARVLYWLGVPVLRSRADDRYNAINDIIREEAARRPGLVEFIDLDRQFRGPDGAYTDFIGDVQVRTPDGVHFTRSGGDQIAQTVIDRMHETFDLTSWRRQAPAATPITPGGTAVTPTTVPSSSNTTAPRTGTTNKK